MLKSLFRVRVLSQIVAALVFGPLSVSVLHAQVFSPPTAPPGVGVQQAGGADSVGAAGAVKQTAWGIPMPTLTMPKLSMPQMAMPNLGAVTGPFKSSLSKVTSGSQKAWEGTKEIFSFGKKKSAASARRQSGGQQPSFWQRLLVRESQQTSAPRTVGEFMRQPKAKLR